MKILLEIAVAVGECPGDTKSFEEILKLTNRLIDYRSACLFLVDRDTGKLIDYARVGNQTDLISFVRFNRGEGFSAWVAKQRRPILIRGTGRSRSLPDKDIKSFMSVPIFCGRELVGVVNMSHEEAGAFDQADLNLLRVVCSQLTAAIQRFYLQTKLEEREKESELQNQKISELGAKLEEAGGSEGALRLFSEIESGTAEALASVAGNTQFLLLALEGKDPKLLQKVQEIDRGISELLDLNYRLRNLQGPVRERRVLFRRKEVSPRRT
jgi:transcriptional regulator with GAF, ATPase, and Fis domain